MAGRPAGILTRVLIRSARPDDVPALLPLFEQWGHAQSREAVAAVLAEWDRTTRAEILVCEVDGDVAGMVAVSAGPSFGRPGRYAHLSGLVVSPSHRREGIGGALLDAVEEWARDWGCDYLELTSSRSRTAAHVFYPARGFEETSGHHARYVRSIEPVTDA
jgi:GNAT superfamily N-acetyltransferase